MAVVGRLACIALLPWMAWRSWGALPAFDFTVDAGRAGWVAQHDIASLAASPDGWVAVISGADPYLAGPPSDFPAGLPLWMHVRIRSQASGQLQVFHFQDAPSEENSVRLHVRGGEWQELRVALPPLGPRTRLRLDPPGNLGTCVVARIRFEPRPKLPEPNWQRPSGEAWEPVAAIQSGDVAFLHGPRLGQFRVVVAGQSMAIGHDRLEVGCLEGGRGRWTTLGGMAEVTAKPGEIRVKTRVEETDGGAWEVEQVFRASRREGGIEFEARLGTTRDREVVHVPWMVLLPGAGEGGFGAHKKQALLAGVEYLEDEPSSSEADLVGPASRRQVPDSLKLTFPLAAISARERWLGMTWEPGPGVGVLHDSPDRTFGSGGHVMGLVFPGASPGSREDGALMPQGPTPWKAGSVAMCRGTFLGGRGRTVVPAVREFVGRRGLPKPPAIPGMDLQSYARMTARGWLRSEVRDGARFRHAVGPGFGSGPASDAALGILWLSQRVTDPGLAGELGSLARAAVAEVPVHHLHSACIGHVRHAAAAPLVLGHLGENISDALGEGRRIVASFGPDGVLRYQRPSGGMDLGRTHGSSEASGLAGGAVARLLELAAFTGDRQLREDGLRLLRGLVKFRETVPRGAQTWEIPLHTPDILASAHMVRAWTLGYELAGDEGFLEEARYWAWTGLAFVYLESPRVGPVGVYGTIAVLGATQFVAPVWMGLPVQWCGLVYGDAVRRLARHDPGGPWVRVADGVAWAGLQHTLASEGPRHEGLLPDSYDLRAQSPNPVPINPATLFPEAIQALGAPALFDIRRMGRTGWVVQAPGTIRPLREAEGEATFIVDAWPEAPWTLIVDGLKGRPDVRLEGKSMSKMDEESWDGWKGRWTVRLRGSPLVEIRQVKVGSGLPEGGIGVDSHREAP